MGRIRTKLVKRVGQKLINENPSFFANNFEDNKKKVAERARIATTKLRNLIAGYITKKTITTVD